MNTPRVATHLLATDRQHSVLQVLAANGQRAPIAYSPYGHRPELNGLMSLLGFNGERPEPITGHYLLGNGYRAFNPVLMRFNSPDSLSPFDEGGLNPYAYGLGDPINHTDPTGHIPKWVPIVAGVVGMVAGVLVGGIASASAFALLSTKLSVGLGAVSVASSVGATALDVTGRSSANESMQFAAVGLSFLSGFAGGFAIGGNVGTRLKTAWYKGMHASLKTKKASTVSELQSQVAYYANLGENFSSEYAAKLAKVTIFNKPHSPTGDFVGRVISQHNARLEIELGRLEALQASTFGKLPANPLSIRAVSSVRQ